MAKYLTRFTIIFVIFLIGCSTDNREIEQYEHQSESTKFADTSLWLVDWDYEASIEEATSILNYIDNILLFGTYFTESGHFKQTEQFSTMIDLVFDNKQFLEKNLYVTIVNDQFLNDGTVIQKSPELLRELLSTTENRQHHIDDIIQLANNYTIHGVEIDYEKIPTDLIDDYIQFIEELDSELHKLNLQLRVILEPGFPIEQYDLPKEPQYVVMAYNLHGYHSDAGPKADLKFLDELATKFPNDSNRVEIALATGGFSWQDSTVTSLNEQEIKELIQTYNPTIKRDENSMANTFTYNDDSNTVEVWYADEETLLLWIEQLVEKGNYNSFSFWRAGGLSEKTLNRIVNIKIEN